MIMISWENRQKVLNIVVCFYGLTIFHKTRYQLSRIMHPHIGHVSRLSFCVVRHQRSSRLTSCRPAALNSTLLTTAFGAVYSSVCTRSRWKMWMNWSSTCGGLVWPMADRCRWRNRRMEKTFLGLCSSKGTALWTSAVTSDYDVANQQFVQLQTLAL